MDNDPQALVASKDNAGRNGVESTGFRLRFPDSTTPQMAAARRYGYRQYSGGTLMELSDTLLHFLKPGGTLMLSGLLNTQAQG